MKKVIGNKKNVHYFLKNAPLAIITSTLPGFVNYAAILFLTAQGSFEEVGQYRLIMSYFSLMGLFSLMESNKIQVRAAASGETQVTLLIFFARLYGMLLCLGIVGAAYLYNSYTNTLTLPASILIVAWFAFLNYPTDLLISTFQAQKKFGLLALITAAKYTFSLIVLISSLSLGSHVVEATLYQLLAMSAVNIVFFCLWFAKPLVSQFEFSLLNPVYVFRDKNVKDALTLSVAKVLPSTLEHADKMIIGSIFGLETLGLYTLAFSTGRFIYNALKPAFYIYYRHYVDALPPKSLLNLVMAVFSGFGLLLSLIFYLCTLYVPAFGKFEGAETVVYIFFLSYGIAMVDAIYTQSYGINTKADTKHFLIANTAVSLACYALFAGCLVLSGPQSMILCALHYPLWHAGTIYMLSRLRIKKEKLQKNN